MPWGKFSEEERTALLPELDRRKADDLRQLEEKKKRNDNA